MASLIGIPAIGLAAKRATRRPPRKLEIRVEPGIDFEATHVVYHVTVRNRGEVTARDVVITPRVLHGSFFIDEPPKAVPVLKPGTFGTATFRAGAKGEPGELEVGARIAYYNRDTGERHEASAPPLRIHLRSPAAPPSRRSSSSCSCRPRSPSSASTGGSARPSTGPSGLRLTSRRLP